VKRLNVNLKLHRVGFDSGKAKSQDHLNLRRRGLPVPLDAEPERGAGVDPEGDPRDPGA